MHTYINIYLIKGNNNSIPVINTQGTVYKCIHILYIFCLDKNNDIINTLYKFLFEKGTFLWNINFTGHRDLPFSYWWEGRDLGKYCLPLFQIYVYASTFPLFILFFLHVLCVLKSKYMYQFWNATGINCILITGICN